MVLLKEMIYDEENHCTKDGEGYLIRPIDYLEGEKHRGHIPAWSLHRLIKMMPVVVFTHPALHLTILSDSVFYCTEDNNEDYEMPFSAKMSIYDNIIDCIEWLIKEGYFNKEYLNGNN